jgi:hypothetical protein
MSLKIVSRSLPNAERGYSPAGERPFPAVLLLPRSAGKWSGWTHKEATILAAHGFLTIPFGYSNGGRTRATSSMCRSTGQPRRWLLRAHELSANEIGF